MRSIGRLTSKINKLSAQVDQQQQAENDIKVTRLITSRLLESLSQMDDDETTEYIRPEYSPAEQAMIDRFAKRYHASSAKQRLISELEQQIAREEELSSN